MQNPLYASWSDDGKYIITCDDGELFLWDFDNNNKTPKLSRKIDNNLSQMIVTDKIFIYGDENPIKTLVLNFNFETIFESPKIVYFSDDMKLTATIHENKKK